MSAIETLESIASLLPDEQRERFLKVVVRFRHVPEDDEILQIIEAIGFMTLLWKEVPEQIKGLLEGAKAPTETTHTITGVVRETVNAAIPSYEDLKTIAQRMEEHELALKNTLSRQTKPKKSSGWMLVGVKGFAAGFLVARVIPSIDEPLRFLLPYLE